MVQLSQSKQPRVESTFEEEKQQQDGCDFNTAAEFQNTEKDFAEDQGEGPLESLDRTTACQALSRAADVSGSAPAGWLMGPLFQSLKSKMASFTEIVMSPVKLFQDKNLSTPEVQPDKTGKSSEAHREPPETGSREAKESSFTLVLQPGSDSCHSRRLFSTSPDEIQVPFPANQELPLLQEPTVKTADIIEKAKVSTRLKTRPRNLNVEKSPPLYSCHVQLDHLHYVSADVSRHETNHVDGTRHETNSGFVRSKRTLSTRVRTERKRLKSETKNGAEPPPLKQKVPSALSDGHEALKRAAKCRNVKRKLLRDEHDDASGKTVKCKSVEPTEPPSSVHLPAPAELAARSEGAPNVGRGRPIKRPAKAPRGELQAQTEKPQAQMSTEPFYFEMTPFEGKPLECSNPNRGGDQDATASRLRNVKVNGKQPRGDPRSRKSRFSRTHAHNATPSATAKDLPTPTTQSGLAGHLLRRYSCPDIPSLFASLPRQPPLTLVPAHDPAGSRRTRRHTVSCGEVEREIAPLCLRKEVYPSRRSFPCDGQNLPPALLPSWSLSALASRFLYSPLAFLSGGGEGKEVTAGITASSQAASVSASSPKTDSLLGAFEACASVSALAGGSDNRTPGKAEEDEDTESSGHKLDEATVAQREEKSLSDSELKEAPKQENPGKVSSIRIRRALPKPQNNLTPMGLPKAIRLKKKQFSLEEIYTNKNFSKPPESRLETVFEVPLSRRDGSESRFGQRRLKRFVEFHEVGEARKPKKVAAGGSKAGAASSRTRRGGFARDDAGPSLLPPPDADSLLCAKLKQLDLWLIGDQLDAAS
ncbi:uncharacterized protein prr14 isoform X2 [Hippocampus comes]|nr:PREDICTED: proline-rich protein 14 isoform X2 [Hippocampus comes]